MKFLIAVLGLILAALAVATLAPTVETNLWWVRYLDFIRLQVGLVLAVVLVLGLAIAIFTRRTVSGLVIAGIATGLVAYHASHLYPYAPFTETMAADVRSCPAGASVTVMSANVQKENRDIERFLDVVAEADPDLLFVMETNAWWDQALSPLSDDYANIVQEIPDDDAYYGLHLFSKLDLVEPETIAYFGSVTPTVQTKVRLQNGSEFAFMGLHPRPPQSFDQPTTMRDGHIAQTAFHAANTQEPLVAAGDFNAVSWETIVRRAMRVGGLLDPRVGRGFIPTYDAKNPVMAWPLDHVLFQDPIGLMRFERLPEVGSDHYPIMATLCLTPDPAPTQSAPAATSDDREELRTAIEAAEAVRP